MKYLIAGALALALLVTPWAYAGELSTTAVGQAGFGDLSSEQQAEVIKQITAMKAQAKGGPASTPAKVGEWVDVGARIGQGLSGAAKELGVAVNDFAKTPVGQLTMAIIVWKMLGGAIVHVVGGLLFLIVGICVVTFLMRRFQAVTIEYGEPRYLWNFIPLGRPVLKYERTSTRGEDAFGWFIAYGLVAVVSAAMIFTF